MVFLCKTVNGIEKIRCYERGYFIGIVAYDLEEIKPCLRPMSSMTKEEVEEHDKIWYYGQRYEQTDWLNAHHFDYRGLIDKGLAIEVTS